MMWGEGKDRFVSPPRDKKGGKEKKPREEGEEGETVAKP